MDESSVEVSWTSTWWGFNGLNKRNFRLLGRDMKHKKSRRCNVRRIMEKAKFHHLKGRREKSVSFFVFSDEICGCAEQIMHGFL